MKFTAQSKIINSFVFKTFVVVLFATLSFLLFSQNPNQVEASINQSLSYQVKVSNPDGTNLTVTDADCLSGTCNFKASLYDAATGGTLVWQQTIAATVGANGITTLKLDCSGTFSNCNQNGGPNFNSGELFLLVEFQPDAGGAYEAFSPRVELVAAPYAFNAYQLDGYGSGDFVKFIESTAQEDTSTDSSIFINKTGEGGYILQLQNDAVDAFLIDYEGKVGIGAASSSALLQLGTTGKLGTLGFAGSTSGLVTVQPAAAAGTWTLTLPTSAGTNGYVLSTDGNGVTSWVAMSGGVTADSLDYDDFVDTMSLDANLITNQTTYTSTFNYTGTSAAGLTYNADSFSSGNAAIEISADALSSGSALFISSASTAAMDESRSLLRLSSSGANANSDGVSTGIIIETTNTGTTSTNTGISVYTAGASTNYGGYFYLSGSTGTKTGLSSSVSGASSAASYSGYFTNITTNTTTDTLAKYGIFVSSTGNFPGLSGGATTNYGLYVDTVSGADANYAAVFAGGNVGIGTITPGYQLLVTKNTEALTDADLPHIRVANSNSDQEDGSIKGNVAVVSVSANSEGAGKVEGWLTASYQSDSIIGTGVDFRVVTNHNFNIWTNNTKRMTVLNTGQVGIGTTTPSSPFTVAPSNATQSSVTSAINIGTASGTVPLSMRVDTLDSGYPTLIWLQTKSGDIGYINSGTYNSVGSLTFGSSTGKQIAMYTNDAYSAPTMLLDTSGRVGIGTVAPSTLLQLGTTGKLGTLGFAGSTSGLVTVQPAAAAGTWTLTLPTSAGTNGYVLSTNGSGVTTWSAVTSLVAADTWDYDDFVDTMSLDANLITNQTTYTSTHNYTGTTTTGLTYNADSVTTANAVEISADGLTTGSGVRLSSTSTAGGASVTSSVLYIDRSGTNAYNAHISTGINIKVANTGTSSINRGVQSTANGGSNNYAGYFVVNGTTGSKTGLFSWVLNDSSSVSYSGYFANTTTNTTTDALAKYGIFVSSTGNFPGSSGRATTNYGLYVDTVSGADANYAAVFAGGNVGIGTSSPSALLSLYGPFNTIPNLNIERRDPDIANGDGLGVIEFAGSDATVLDQIGAKIYAVADNTWDGGTNDAPTRLEFFVQSNGTTDTLTTPALTIDSTGYVGIGTQAPAVALEVSGNGKFSAIGSGTYVGAVNRTSDGTFTTATSDIRFKKDVETITGALDKVNQLRGVTFNWIDPNEPKRMTGMIAQEVIDVMPELVYQNPTDGYYGLLYGETSGLLIEAIKELDDKVDNLGFTVTEIDGVKNLNFDGTLVATNIKAQNIEGMEIISENISTLEDTQVSTEQQITEINDQSLDLQTRLSSAEISIANNVARLDQHSLILDRITAINTQMYQYNMDIQVLGDMFIDGSINVSSEAIFSGQILFNQDTVGQARILTGHTEVYVPFTQEYRYQPVVTLSMLGNNSVNKFYVDEVTTAGFKIKIDGVQADNVTLNWHAFASPNARLVDSTGVVAGIQTYRPLKGLDQIFVDPLIDDTCVGYVETQSFSETHDGVDLAKYEGCIISSVGVGRVIFAGYEDISGNIVRIDHGNGIVTAYAHGTGEFFVEVGDYVDAGDPIMMMGTTGTSTGIHTHFMLIQDGTAINPKGIIPYNAIY